jgi:polysaccharide pyruvyl transferase WcaK-like protein
MTLHPSYEVKSVALLSPYDGGNLGDGAIQQAIIENLRDIDPVIRICGINLNPARTSAEHGIPCYPLAAISRRHYQMTDAGPAPGHASARPSTAPFLRRAVRSIRHLLASVPPLRWIRALLREMGHIRASYTLLRRVDMLIIAGGGQLDEEWGGPWGHPYSLMKWSLLSSLARRPTAFLSVGACSMRSRLAKFFIRNALSLASYRSYRDAESLRLALALTPRAEGAVVPDLAFSLVRTLSGRSRIDDRAPLSVAVSPIAFCHPELWPSGDKEQFERYIAEFTMFVLTLLESGASVALFSSSPPDDQIVAQMYRSLAVRVDADARSRLAAVEANTVDALSDLIGSADAVVTSRLHGALLSLLWQRPVLALSYDRKVQCLMDDMDLSAYCLDIRLFTCAGLLEAWRNLLAKRESVLVDVSAKCSQFRSLLETQYRILTGRRVGNSSAVPDARVALYGSSSGS